MAGIIKKIFVFAYFSFGYFVIGQYTPPSAKVEPLSPKGIRISVPDEPGITLVAFHVKFNEDFNSLEAGTIATDVIRARNGRWTYEDHTTKLSIGDIVYYWIHVVYQGLGYNLLFQEHKVTEFYGKAGEKGGSKNPGCGPTDTKVIDLETGGRRNICAGDLLFNEQFDNLNRSVWTQVEKFAGPPDHAFVVYRNDQRNVKCSNGNLEIAPSLVKDYPELGQDFIRRGNITLEKCTGKHGTKECQKTARAAYIIPPVFSGLVDTKNSFAFIYGKVEIRAKLPRGDWIYPILSLERLDKFSTPSSSTHPQMRIASASGNAILRGSQSKDLGGHRLRGGPTERNSRTGEPVSLSETYSNALWSDDYHVYELEWGRDKTLSRVDGVQYGSVDTITPFDRPFYLNLGLAVGGHGEFPDSCTSDGYPKPWYNAGVKALFDFFNATDLWSNTWNNNDDSTKLKIEYVKVWAL